jgi:predicted nuclease of restriction endonuclease-like RecB superfamily
VLSAEQVRVRRDGERLVLRELSPKARVRAIEIAEELLSSVSSGVGQSRDELEQILDLIELGPSERRLADGLRKLIEDACEFEQETTVDPPKLRSEVFLRATVARRSATLEAPFAREAVLGASGAALELSPELIEAGLYADLRGAHRLRKPPSFSAPTLVNDYERAQVQALLLRAVKVEAVVQCRNPDAYRTLFNKLKFRKLLFELTPVEGGGYRIQIDGPFSLFEAVTKYGIELALTLPALEDCDVLELVASLVWGKARTKLRFEYRRVRPRENALAEPALRDDVSELLQDFRALESKWSAATAEEILDLPGVGLCVPDLVFRKKGDPEPIYVEFLGYWSRDAVWRRVELVERGLPHKIVFLVSSKLRVSEAVLDNEHAALLVFRGKPSARNLERKLEEIASLGPRKRPRQPSKRAKNAKSANDDDSAK